MWSYVDEEGLIENCTVRKKYLNKIETKTKEIKKGESYEKES